MALFMSRERKRKVANFLASRVHEMHRVKLPVTGTFLFPLKVRIAEGLLLEIHEVFGRHAIEFWLRDGTALGVYRDGGLIPYDDDVDLGLWVGDAGKLDAALDELEARGFSVYRRNRHVFGLFKRFETVEFVVSGVYADEGGYHKLLEETFFRALTRVRFLGKDFNLPGPIEPYLEFCYGADWRTPKYGAFWSNSVWLPDAERRAHVEAFRRASREPAAADAEKNAGLK